MAIANTAADNIMNGSAFNQSVDAIRRAANASGIEIGGIRDVSSIVGSRFIQGISERMEPIIERARNMTVYSLNNTPLVSIARSIRLRVRAVEAEHEQIRVNDTSLIIHNVTNPALQVQLMVRRNGSTVERNMTITMTRERNRLNLTVRNATVFTDCDIIYENGTIYISRLNKTIELNTLPDMVKERVRERWQNRAEIREMRLEMANERLRYVVRTRTRRHVLGLFPADVDEESVVSPIQAKSLKQGAPGGAFWPGSGGMAVWHTLADC
jgi:hypothetical protein